MAGFQVTARRQVDDTILMVPTYRKLDTKELIHRVVKPLDDEITLVVWWPERLDPALEERYSAQYARELADRLGIRDTALQ